MAFLLPRCSYIFKVDSVWPYILFLFPRLQVVVIVFGQIGLRIGSRMHDTVKEKAPHTVQCAMLALLIGACTLMIPVCVAPRRHLYIDKKE